GEGHEDVGEREEDRGAEHGAGGGGGPSKVSRARGRASLKIAPGGSGGQSPPPPTALRSVADPGPLPLQQSLVEAPRLAQALDLGGERLHLLRQLVDPALRRFLGKRAGAPELAGERLDERLAAEAEREDRREARDGHEHEQDAEDRHEEFEVHASSYGPRGAGVSRTISPPAPPPARAPGTAPSRTPRRSRA